MGQTFTTQAEDSTLRLVLVTDKTEAHHDLRAAEQLDGYRESCGANRTNARARRLLAYEVNRLGYQEWKRMEVFVEQVHEGTQWIPSRLRRELGEVRLIALMPSAEGGMPHTRPLNRICYPNVETITHGVTLVHELWHLHQRAHRAWWSEVFHEWGWTALSDEEAVRQIPASLREHVRMNPDTIDQRWWAYHGRWVPLPVFTNLGTPSMTETELWWYDLHDRFHVRTTPSEITTEFPGVSANALEHPRELAAYLLSDKERYQNAGIPGWNRLVELVGVMAIQ